MLIILILSPDLENSQTFSMKTFFFFYLLDSSWRNINNVRYAEDTTLMAESEEELKSPLEESESGE